MSSQGLQSLAVHYICNICAGKYESKEEVEYHKYQFHDRIKCRTCDYLAFGDTGLKEHMKNSHRNTNINV